MQEAQPNAKFDLVVNSIISAANKFLTAAPTSEVWSGTEDNKTYLGMLQLAWDIYKHESQRPDWVQVPNHSPAFVPVAIKP